MPREQHLPFKQARNYYAGRTSKPIFIVVHDGEIIEAPDSAEGMQDFFAGANAPQASAHLAADDNSLVRSVHDWDTAWAAPGVNSNGLHIEQAGRASQNRSNWLDKYSKTMIENYTALGVAYWSVLHGIPLVKRSADDIRHSRGGVVGHIDVTEAEHTVGGHTDPGRNYPWNVLLGAAHEHVQDVSRPHIVHNPYALPRTVFGVGASGDKVRFVQWALGIPVDGVFGNQTRASVEAFQRKHNLHVDGVCGPQTLAALATITHIH